MKKEHIKKQLKKYSIYDKRRTTLNHAFASAIAPQDTYKTQVIDNAIKFLGQDPNKELKCVFCRKEAETWDHLTGLVKDGNLRGYGHQIGNLVPCCKKCNSKKGNKEFSKFINEYDEIHNKNELIKLLSDYQNKFAKKIDLELLKHNNPRDFSEYKKIKDKIFSLMQEADKIADILRNNIV